MASGKGWRWANLLSKLPSSFVGVSSQPEARSRALAEVEAILWVAREPIGTRKLAQLAGLADGTEARTLVRKLNALYDSGGRAFRIEEIAGGLQLMSRWKFAPWLRRLHTMPVEVRLSAPAMETLAVVAYRQPALRAQIEAVRGVQCGEILRQLMEKDLVRIVGRSDELGRPFLYGTSKTFLRVFGLRHLDELPRPGALGRTAGRDALRENAEPKRELIPQNGNMSKPEEANRMTLATMFPTTPELFEEAGAGLATLPQDDRLIVNAADEEDDVEEGDDDVDDDEDLDEDFDDEEEDEEDDLDDDFDDDWEEVDDEEDEEEEDEDWDEDWDDDEDEDDDWDDDDEDEEE